MRFAKEKKYGARCVEEPLSDIIEGKIRKCLVLSEIICNFAAKLSGDMETDDVMTGRNLSRVISRIDHLARLKNDWDGFGASSVLPSVITNIRSVILASKDVDWKDWTVSPNVNGTLFLQSTKYVSSLSLGEKEYSFFSKKDGQREGKSHIPFSVDGFLSMMRTLNK